MSVQGSPNDFSSFYRREAPRRASIPPSAPDSPGGAKKHNYATHRFQAASADFPPTVFGWVEKMGIEINKIK
jgi:hypothetical protein